jgi:hypothetical protein
MNPKEINFLIFQVSNEQEKMMVGNAYVPLTGYYQNLLFAYELLNHRYLECDIVFN